MKTWMRYVNFGISVLIAIGGFLYIIDGIKDGDMGRLAAGWVMLVYSKLCKMDDDLYEVKDDIKQLKIKK
jgi:hypothetical protein